MVDQADSRAGRCAEIEARANAATPGPANDRCFIAHARSDIPWLLSQLAQAEERAREAADEISRLKSQLAAAREALKRLRDDWRLDSGVGNFAAEALRKMEQG